MFWVSLVRHRLLRYARFEEGLAIRKFLRYHLDLVSWDRRVDLLEFQFWPCYLEAACFERNVVDWFCLIGLLQCLIQKDKLHQLLDNALLWPSDIWVVQFDNYWSLISCLTGFKSQLTASCNEYSWLYIRTQASI